MRLMMNTRNYCYARRYVALLFLVVAMCLGLNAQKKWTGNINDRWDNPLNWLPAGVPSISDDVILNNDYLQNTYRVILPDNTTEIHSLFIEPAAGKSIELMLPPSSIASPGLHVYESGNSILLREGGRLKNSSGLNSGQSIALGGLLCIYNGASYIHNSRSGHAADVVAKLSTAPGTENGEFEFDVPGGSYPISLSNRAYGSLVLSSAASGGSQTYNASGSNAVSIRGNLKINSGVQFNVDLTRDMVVSGSYIQSGGVFNLASQDNSNVVRIKGNVNQDSAGLITESAAGFPVLELSGSSHQQVLLSGKINNSVTLRIDNPNGISLMSKLAISYRLDLVAGNIKSSATSFITLMDNCIVNGGSASSFIDGPIEKIGDEDFEFPIGKENDYAPLKITSTNGAVTDDFIAEYVLSNPGRDYGPSFENPPMVRISALEYWVLQRTSGSSPRKISLRVGTYSNATALEKLVVARWDGNASTWKNAGNSFYSGVAVGVITSNYLNDFGALTLASVVETQNPLPVEVIDFTANINTGGIDLKWATSSYMIADHYEVETSSNGNSFQSLGSVNHHPGTLNYQFRANVTRSNLYFRIKIIKADGGISYTPVIKAKPAYPCFIIRKLYPIVARNEIIVDLRSDCSDELELIIVDFSGKIARVIMRDLQPGDMTIKIDLQGIQQGTYVLLARNAAGTSKGMLFFKQ